MYVLFCFVLFFLIRSRELFLSISSYWRAYLSIIYEKIKGQVLLGPLQLTLENSDSLGPKLSARSFMGLFGGTHFHIFFLSIPPSVCYFELF